MISTGMTVEIKVNRMKCFDAGAKVKVVAFVMFSKSSQPVDGR